MGSACAYSHDDSIALKQDHRRLRMCTFYLKGRCLQGSECPYSHSASEIVEAETRRGQEPVLRTIGGAVVKFGIGGTVTRLSMIESFSSVCIDGLSEAELERLPSILKDHGHDLLPSETVRAVKVNGDSGTSVYITSDDPTFAARFCAEIQTSGTPKLHTVSVPPRFPPGTITRQISCNKVVVSWSRPTRAVYLHYDTYAEAGYVAGAFNRGEYTVDGFPIEASYPKAHKDKWRTMLRNTAFDVTEAKVKKAIRSSSEKLAYIRLGEKCASFDEASAPALASTLFNAIGKVEHISAVRNGGRWCTMAIHYEDELDALNAVKKLHGKPQEFLGDEPLTVLLMSTSKVKIPRRIYDAINDQIDSVVKTHCKGHKLSVKVFPDNSATHRFLTLSMQGEDKGKLSALTGTVESMLAGKIIEVSSDIFETLVWSRSVARQLQEIQSINQVLIMTNKAKKQLIFFGSSTKYEQVKHAILGLTPAKSVFTYHLNHKEFAWLQWGGFDKIISVLGVGVASFNESSHPKSITIDGSKEQYQKARSILETRGGSLGLDDLTLEPSEQERDPCSICWTPAEDPVTLICGHLYCAECLEDLCRSCSSDDADFLVTCKGANDTCKRIMSLNEVEANLSSRAFEDVLRLSFASYVRRRANMYHFCPTPDCGSIYTSTEDNATTTTTCLNCMGVTCTTCHAQHGITSCEDYQYEKAGGEEAFNRYKREHGGKDCPKCKAHIEKIEGCNHMTCGVCKAHLCWVCMDVFDTGQKCCDHLAAEHGGFGIEGPVEDDGEANRLNNFIQRARVAAIDLHDHVAVVLFAQARLARGHRIPAVINAMIEHPG